MPLTEEQQKVAKAPWHYSDEDVYRVMETFAREPDEQYTFGADRYHILMQLLKVAVSRTITVPVRYSELIRALELEFSGKCARLDKNYYNTR